MPCFRATSLVSRANLFTHTASLKLKAEYLATGLRATDRGVDSGRRCVCVCAVSEKVDWMRYIW